MAMAPKPTGGGPPGLSSKNPKPNAAVLLVEQDDGVRRYLFWALYLEGFKVLTARGPSDAQRLSRDIPGRIEVMIIGSLPTGGSRVVLQEQIETERPEVRTLFLEDLESAIPEPARVSSDHAGDSSPGKSVDVGKLIQKIKAIVAASGS